MSTKLKAISAMILLAALCLMSFNDAKSHASNKPHLSSTDTKQSSVKEKSLKHKDTPGSRMIQLINLPHYSYCAGDTLDVVVNINWGLNPGNILNIEMSDAYGDFSQAVVIGSLLTQYSSTIACIIPPEMPSGNGYRMRVTSSNPVNVSADNGEDIIIRRLPQVDMISDVTICYASNLPLSPTVIDYDSLFWSTTGYGWFSSPNVFNPLYFTHIQDSAAGSIVITLSAFSHCGSVHDSLNLNLTTEAVANAGPDKEICPGEQTQLFATGGSFYAWSNPLSMCCPSVANPTAWPSLTTTYTVTVTSACGSATDSVVVNVLPEPDVTLTKSGTPILCQGDSMLLTATLDTGYTYHWFHNNSHIPSVQSFLYYASDSGSYKVMAINQQGCSDFSNTVHISVVQPPYTTIKTIGNTTFCEGNSAILYIDTIKFPDINYQWYINSNIIANHDNKPLVVHDEGNYSAFLTDTNACTAYTPPINITVHDKPPQPTITEDHGNLYSSATEGNQWYQDSILIQGANQMIYTPTVSAYYNVKEISLEGCSSLLSAPYYFSLTSVTDHMMHPVIYPNPAKRHIILDNLYNNSEALTITIFDNSGRQVFKTTNMTDKNRISVDLKELNSGNYFMHLKNNHHNSTYKIIIE